MKPDGAGMHVYLVCGVSGSGKSWVCRQVAKKFNYVPHDENYHDISGALFKAAENDRRPLITESPFGERIVRERLEAEGMKVTPVFVVEDPDLVAKRYQEREGKPLPKSAFTRAGSIRKRAEEWGATFGTSAEILKHLSELKT